MSERHREGARNVKSRGCFSAASCVEAGVYGKPLERVKMAFKFLQANADTSKTSGKTKPSSLIHAIGIRFQTIRANVFSQRRVDSRMLFLKR